MTTLFLLVCAVSVIFFLVFLLKCSSPTRKTARSKGSSVSPVHQPAATSPVVDSMCGRRFFVHREEEMAEFLTAHGRHAAVMLIAATRSFFMILFR